MAKKIDEEHMAQMFGGFGLTCNTPIPQSESNVVDTVHPQPTPSQEQETEPNTDGSIPSEPTAAEPPKKKKKVAKVSFMCRLSEDNLMKIRMLSAISSKSISDYIDESVSSFLEEYEAKNGVIRTRKHYL